MDSYLHQGTQTENVGPCTLDSDLHNEYIDDVVNPAGQKPQLASIIHNTHQQITVGRCVRCAKRGREQKTYEKRYA